VLPLVLLVIFSLVIIGISQIYFIKRDVPLSIKDLNNPLLTANVDTSLGGLIAGNCMLRNEKGDLVLFYYTKSDLDSDVTEINFALSEDGVTFIKNNDVVIPRGEKGDWDSGGVLITPNCVVERKANPLGRYWLFYTGVNENKPDFYWNSGGIGLAFSNDLVHWEKYPENPILLADPSIEWENQGVFEPAVIFTGDEFGTEGSFKMWYGGNNNEGRMSIGYAESANGVEWKKHVNNPVLTYSENENDFDHRTIEVHSVIRHYNQYIIAYEGTQYSFPSRFSIGLAKSKDGLNWNKFSTNPVLEADNVGDWDQMGTYHPSFFFDKGKLYLYYVGLDQEYTHSIGRAEISPYYFYKELFNN